MEALQNLPIGIQSFEKLRNGNYLYVDKTALIYQLVNSGSYFFLSRPRRFGKSMLISTIQAYFEGKKELFDGLDIAKLEHEWTKHPVLHLDLNTETYDKPESLINKLSMHLTQWEKIYGRRDEEKSPAARFEGVIRRAYESTGQGVVILIDEYDKPILQTIDKEQLQDEYRATLKGFYGALKSMDACIRFAILTGVTKFGQVSVFSDINNLRDISMERGYVEMCGLTDHEIDTTLAPYVNRLARNLNRTTESVRQELRERYDGYHFLNDTPGIYNPFSVLLTFQSNEFGNYWFDTGTPTFLVKMIQKNAYDLENLEHAETGKNILNSITPTSSPLPVIYQSGYLTIKDYDPEFQLYTLGFPNKEVKEGFYDYLLPQYASIPGDQSATYIKNFVTDVRSGNVDSFMQRLSSLFSDTPYELVKNLENHYQNVIFILAKLMGFYVKAEYHTSQGRIDLVIQTNRFIYVMEFKFDGTAEDALQQIRDKQYALPFATDSRQVICIGINFSSATRNIDRWLTE
jgi:hypothetical protein